MKFTEKHGHSRVPRNPKEEMLSGDSNNLRLSRWVSQCRAEYRKAPDDRLHLDDIKIFILNKLGFDWDPSETKFQARREQLKAFKEKHGHCRVPYNKYSQEDDGLSAWVKRQVRMTHDRVFSKKQDCSNWYSLLFHHATAIPIQTFPYRETQ